MLIKLIQGFTRMFGAPPDWKEGDDRCNALAIRDVATEQGNFMVSAWEPSVEEMQAMINGASVQLWIRGVAHPVVALKVEGVE